MRAAWSGVGEGVPKATKGWMSGPEPQRKKARPKGGKSSCKGTKKGRIRNSAGSARNHGKEPGEGLGSVGMWILKHMLDVPCGAYGI